MKNMINESRKQTFLLLVSAFILYGCASTPPSLVNKMPSGAWIIDIGSLATRDFSRNQEIKIYYGAVVAKEVGCTNFYDDTSLNRSIGAYSSRSTNYAFTCVDEAIKKSPVPLVSHHSDDVLVSKNAYNLPPLSN